MESPLQKKAGEIISAQKRTPRRPLTQEDLRTLALEIVKIALIESSPTQWDNYLSGEEFGERMAAEIKILCDILDKQRRMKSINLPS
jgi:hypothetical protein